MHVHVCIHTRVRTSFCWQQREAQTPDPYRARRAELNASTSAESVGQDRARNAPPGARPAAHWAHGGEGRREGHGEGRGQQGAPNDQAPSSRAGGMPAVLWVQNTRPPQQRMKLAMYI